MVFTNSLEFLFLAHMISPLQDQFILNKDCHNLCPKNQRIKKMSHLIKHFPFKTN